MGLVAVRVIVKDRAGHTWAAGMALTAALFVIERRGAAPVQVGHRSRQHRFAHNPADRRERGRVSLLGRVRVAARLGPVADDDATISGAG